MNLSELPAEFWEVTVRFFTTKDGFAEVLGFWILLAGAWCFAWLLGFLMSVAFRPIARVWHEEKQRSRSKEGA